MCSVKMILFSLCYLFLPLQVAGREFDVQALEAMLYAAAEDSASREVCQAAACKRGSGFLLCLHIV